jgi:hypothetical protein
LIQLNIANASFALVRQKSLELEINDENLKILTQISQKYGKEFQYANAEDN